MKLRNTTKMAFQAAVAIALAEIISLYFDFDRGYWITLTAMALTTQTWGESVKRSLERVGMTGLGGVVGTALFFFLPDNQPMVLILLLTFIFFTVYTLKIYHLVSVFFLTCFVVFLFALIGSWTWLMLRERILDTALGALIALTVGWFFFSLKTDINDLFIGYLQKMKALLATVFGVTIPVRAVVTSQKMAADFEKIRKDALSIRYELLFHRLNPQDFYAVLNQMARCTQYVINLIESYQWLMPHMSKEDNASIGIAAKTTEHNIDMLIMQLQKQPGTMMAPATSVSDLLTKAIADNPCRFATLESDALGFFSLMYFFTQLNTCLNEVYALIDKS